MSRNASPINSQQVHADNGTPTAEVSSPQATLPPSSPVQAIHTLVDAAVFAGSNIAGPIKIRDGTPHISFVPIRGTFTDATIAPQAEPISPANKDGKNNAPSPLALSPTPSRTEKSPSPPPIPIPPRSQPGNQPGADSPHRSVLIGADTDRERHSPEDLSTLWRQVKALD